jgi:predicted SAM-dependent methyltransferase
MAMTQDQPSTTRRLQWGCGHQPAPGWINSDLRPGPGVDLCVDIRDGLPLPDGSLNYAVAMHALQDLAWPDVSLALRELKRVLKPTGVLRLGLPDLDRAIDAYLRRDAAYFHVPDEHARCIGAKLVTQIIWYGSVRTPFTFDFVHELLSDVGFHDVQRCEFGRTASRHSEIVSLDNRPRESMFVEATA